MTCLEIKKTITRIFFPFLVIEAITHQADDAVSVPWYIGRKFTIVVTGVLIILPLSIPKEIGFQKYARYKPPPSNIISIIIMIIVIMC